MAKLAVGDKVIITAWGWEVHNWMCGHRAVVTKIGRTRATIEITDAPWVGNPVVRAQFSLLKVIPAALQEA